MTTRAAQPPTKEQLDRIREMSRVVLGDTDRLFHEVGEPETRWAASRMLGALHKIRNLEVGGSSEERALISQIEEIDTDTPTPVPQEEPTLMPETKTCSTCKEDKTLDEFSKNKQTPDGLMYSCKDCDRERARLKREKKKADGRARNGKPVAAPKVEERVSSHSVRPPWHLQFHNPTLLQLRLLSQFLGGTTLDETAEVCEKIAAGSEA